MTQVKTSETGIDRVYGLKLSPLHILPGILFPVSVSIITFSSNSDNKVGIDPRVYIRDFFLV